MLSARPLGQHWTFGQKTVQPIVPPPPVTNPSSIPFVPIAIACALLTALVIAGTIIIALIPVYLRPRPLTPQCASAPSRSIFNTQSGTLPTGPLSTNNRNALQSGLNGVVRNQQGFSRCSVAVSNSDVANCPANQRLLQKRRKRHQDSSLKRYARQTNNNCVNQQISSTSTLDCGCRCVGRCLTGKVNQLNTLLRTRTLTITFPDSGLTIPIFGIDIPLTRVPLTTISNLSPVTASPTTASTVTVSPTTASTVTVSPTTASTVTASPTTASTVTASPTTASTITGSSTTASTVTDSSTTASTVTDSPTTASTVTDSSTTASTVTDSPTTASTVTDSSTTASTVTDSTTGQFFTTNFLG